MGTVDTSSIFLITILSIAIFLTITKRDQRVIVENVGQAISSESKKTEIIRDEDLLVD